MDPNLILEIQSLQLPTNNDKSNLPVIVFIHGGGHFFGFGGFYGPAYLLDSQDVILVTFNYRLGVLGTIAKLLSIIKCF